MIIYSTSRPSITPKRFMEMHRSLIKDHGDLWMIPHSGNLLLLIDRLNIHNFRYNIFTGYKSKKGEWIPIEPKIYIIERGPSDPHK
jgi:hypothetical protein